MEFFKGRKIGRNVPQSDAVCVRDFLQSWNLEALEAVRIRPDIDDYEEDNKEKLIQITKKMNIDEETVKELADVCHPDTLFTGEEPRTRKDMLQINSAPNVHLECVRHQMEVRRRREESEMYARSTVKHIRYNHLFEFVFDRPTEEPALADIPAESCVPVPNVLLSIEVSKCFLSGDIQGKNRHSETLLVLGTQKLSDLKDAIKCPLDDVIAGDFSCMPDVDTDSLLKAKHIYKSGFFFIENVFYNDMRQADNKDYSKPILDWAKSNWPDEELSTADMAATQFLDLNIRLGCYYLFTHQGNCEHSILFQDIRLFSSNDVQDIRLYPQQIVHRPRARKLCQGCCKISAQWVVLDSPLIPTDPCLLCHVCFKSLLYTKDGQKTSNFKAHLYAEYCL